MGPTAKRSTSRRSHTLPLLLLTLVSLLATTTLWITSSSGGPTSRFGTRGIRTAICLCGTTRTFHQDAVHESIQRHLITPYRRLGQVELFAILRFEDDAAPGRRQGVTRVEATKRALEKLGIHRVIQFGDDVEDRTHHRVLNKTDKLPVRIRPPPYCKSLSKPADLSHTLLRTQDCLTEVQRHERNTGRRFDWVIRTRFDVAFLKDVPVPNLFRRGLRRWLYFWKPSNELSSLTWNRFYTSRTIAQFTRPFAEYISTVSGVVHRKHVACGDGMSDHVFLMSRKVAETALNAWEIVNDCDVFKLPVPNVESALRFFLLKHHVVPHALQSLLWVTVREGLGPECHKTRVLDSQTFPWPNATRECFRFARSIAHAFPDSPVARHNDSRVDDEAVERIHVPPRQKYEFALPQC